MSEQTTAATAIQCVRCGRFMSCEDPDAGVHYEPDNHFTPEVVEWTCGPCNRARDTADPEQR